MNTNEPDAYSTDDWERTLGKRARRRRRAEAIEGVAFVALVAVAFWLLVWHTPPQMSAEYDWACEMEAR